MRLRKFTAEIFVKWNELRGISRHLIHDVCGGSLRLESQVEHLRDSVSTEGQTATIILGLL